MLGPLWPIVLSVRLEKYLVQPLFQNIWPVPASAPTSFPSVYLVLFPRVCENLHFSVSSFLSLSLLKNDQRPSQPCGSISLLWQTQRGEGIWEKHSFSIILDCWPGRPQDFLNESQVTFHQTRDQHTARQASKLYAVCLCVCVCVDTHADCLRRSHIIDSGLKHSLCPLVCKLFLQRCREDNKDTLSGQVGFPPFIHITADNGACADSSPFMTTKSKLNSINGRVLESQT